MRRKRKERNCNTARPTKKALLKKKLGKRINNKVLSLSVIHAHNFFSLKHLGITLVFVEFVSLFAPSNIVFSYLNTPEILLVFGELFPLSINVFFLPKHPGNSTSF